MTSARPIILVLNGGSSSIRFSLYRSGAVLERQLRGKLERIGLRNPRLSFSGADGGHHVRDCAAAADHPAAVKVVLDLVDSEQPLTAISAVGHRVVHGLRRTKAETVTPALIDELRGLQYIDPDHLPGAIALIEACRRRASAVPQMVCFDTEFHSHMPSVARLMAVPRRLEAKGVQRYGFHGLSYAYLMEELARAAAPVKAQERVILAHLGSGASLAAVLDGRSIDTSMGFTPASGLPMGTRSGDLDPGLAPYLARTERMTAHEFDAMVNHQSGLLGVSETSSDMQELLANEASDARAADAVALFCYQTKKWVGAFAAALGGLDTLVFTGGIGENAEVVRARVCDGLEFLGIELDESRNAANAGLISSDSSRVSVRVIRTDEELMIARMVCRALGLSS